MIFGFNTDIKVDNTVYHVQSEARTAEKLLQTQVFVKGHCIGKRAVSYATDEAGGQTEEVRHELLRNQHRTIVQAIREGHLDSIIEDASVKLAAAHHPDTAAPSPTAPGATSTPTATNPAASTPAGIELKFLGSSRPTEDALAIRFGVAMSNAAVEGATLLAQILPDANANETFSGGSAKQGKTNREGLVEISLPIPARAQGEANLVVQVNHAGLSVAKKFRIKTKA